MDNIKRRSFLKGLFGVAVAPLMPLFAKLKPKVDLPRTSDRKDWKNYTTSYDPDMKWPSEEKLRELIWAANQKASFQRTLGNNHWICKEKENG